MNELKSDNMLRDNYQNKKTDDMDIANDYDHPLDDNVPLDVDEVEFIMIYHYLNPKNKFYLNRNKFIKSKFLLNLIDSDNSVLNNENGIEINFGESYSAFEFIMKYLEISELSETPIPEKPIKDDFYKNWGNDEKMLFECLYKNNSDLSKNEEQSDQIFKIIQLVNYLDIEILLHKLCAIVAYKLKSDIDVSGIFYDNYIKPSISGEEDADDYKE